MNGIPSALYQLCRTTFLKCSEFDSNDTVRSLFITDNLKPFRNGLPESTNKNGRVDLCLSYLVEKQSSDGQPILFFFLKVLYQRYEEGDALRNKLKECITLIEQSQAQITKTSFLAKTTAIDKESPAIFERLELMQTLSALMPEQLDLIIFALTPPPGIIPTIAASQGTRVSALLQWAGSPGGCGLDTVLQVLNQILKK